MDICIDCDGAGKYPSGAKCLSCEGSGRVLCGDGIRLHFPDHPAFEPMGQQILCSLGQLSRGYGLQRPENKYWNRYADALIEKGFAEDVMGFVAITDLGRDQIRSNSQ